MGPAVRKTKASPSIDSMVPNFSSSLKVCLKLKGTGKSTRIRYRCFCSGVPQLTRYESILESR